MGGVFLFVDPIGLEPITFRMPCERSNQMS